MKDLNIIIEDRQSIETSFQTIAEKLFFDYQLAINGNVYRLLDIEFYYFAKDVFEDVFAHKHEAQLETGKWYFHGSGIDITIGNGTNHGGILIRAIAKISKKSSEGKNYIEKEIHGPLNVKTEMSSRLHGAFDSAPNLFYFKDISSERTAAAMKSPEYIIKTKRIGLNAANDTQQSFYNGKYRFIIFPYLKLKDKTRIALDMNEQFPDMSNAEINKELGSIFIR
jgi:hypothetical protein